MHKKISWTIPALLAATLLAGTDAYGFSLGSLFGNNTGGTVSSTGALVNNTSSAVGISSTGNNMNVCPMALSSFGGSLPLLPCGGAVPLLNQPISFGGIQIGTSTGSGSSTGNDPVGDSWCTDGTALTGSQITVPSNTVSLILPGTLTATAFNSGAITPPLGSVLAIPDGTSVSLSLNQIANITLPTGGTFLEPDGVTSCFVAPWGTIVSDSHGGIYVTSGADCVYNPPPSSPLATVNSTLPAGVATPPALTYGGTSLSITTSSVLVGTLGFTTNNLYPFRVDTPGSVLVPEGATFIGPMNNDIVSLSPNTILTALGNLQVQMPGNGGLFTYATGTTTVGLVTPTVVTPPTFSLALDASGALSSPQNVSSTCGVSP